MSNPIQYILRMVSRKVPSDEEFARVDYSVKFVTGETFTGTLQKLDDDNYVLSAASASYVFSAHQIVWITSQAIKPATS